MRHLLLIAGVLMVFGCDPEDVVNDLLPDAAAPEPIDIQLDAEDETPIRDLTPEERDGVCQNSIDAINNGVGASDKCDLAGLTFGLTVIGEGAEAAREKCAEHLGSCTTAASATGAPDVPINECNLFGGDVSECDLPVRTLEICLTQMSVAAANTLISFSCESADLEKLASDGFEVLGSSVPDSTECAELELQCPGVFQSN